MTNLHVQIYKKDPVTDRILESKKIMYEAGHASKIELHLGRTDRITAQQIHGNVYVWLKGNSSEEFDRQGFLPQNELENVVRQINGTFPSSIYETLVRATNPVIWHLAEEASPLE